MYDDNLFAADIVHCILNGEIVERQWDDVWNEFKYIIEGQSADEIDDETYEQVWLHVVAKLGRDDDTVTITVYTVEDYA